MPQVLNTTPWFPDPQTVSQPSTLTYDNVQNTTQEYQYSGTAYYNNNAWPSGDMYGGCYRCHACNQMLCKGGSSRQYYQRDGWVLPHSNVASGTTYYLVVGPHTIKYIYMLMDITNWLSGNPFFPIDITGNVSTSVKEPLSADRATLKLDRNTTCNI